MSWAVVLLEALLAVSTAAAQQPDIVVGKIPFPEREWGRQNLAFQVTNVTPALKFLTVETDIAFEGSYVNPRRVTRTNFMVMPESSTQITPELEIPSNYGNLKLWIRIFDVVDTLDDISLGQQVFEQPFHIKFPAPETILPYFQEKISLPPAIGDHGLFDNEFARLLPIMLAEGKSVTEIADLAQTDTAFVRTTADLLVNGNYLKYQDGVYSPVIPVIGLDFAKDGRKLADSLSDRLVRLITDQLPEGRRVLDSLVKAGSLSGDSNNFYEGAQLLYRPYPLVTTVCLWRELGSRFVMGQGPLVVFYNTDPCHGDIRMFMYLVQGGDYYNGHQYYDADIVHNGLNVRFGDTTPRVVCDPGFERIPKSRENAGWNFPKEFAADSYLMDSTFVLPVCRAILSGGDAILRDGLSGLRDLSNKHGLEQFVAGTRYWFWDLTATLITDKLLEAGTLTRIGNGQYRILAK